MSLEPTDPPAVSFVIPALNEAAYLAATLRSIRELESDVPYEVIVVDGGSTDRTPAIAREADATLVEQSAGGIGRGRHLGACHARGAWLAFVDADTRVRPAYLDTMLEFVAARDLDAATSRCSVVGCRRAKLVQATINRLFPRLARPVLPGFNLLVDREAYHETGGFPDVPNEDTAFSREFARSHRTGYCPQVLVETSGRRVASSGLSRTLAHYLALDWRRIRADY